MNKLYSLLKSFLVSYNILVRRLLIRFIPLIAVAILIPNLLFAEGSKEIYQGGNETHLYLCSNFLTLCDGNGGDRTQFAVYECSEKDRLYIEVFSADEIVYIGLNGDAGFGSNKLVYRIKDQLGGIVLPETVFPINVLEQGYIDDIGEARVGPEQLYGPLGYNAIEFIPPGVGTYYIEFQRVTNIGNNPSPGGFNIDLFDITVANTTTSTAKPGRIHSKAWQLYETSLCSADFYAYSTDSIITSLDMNNLDGGIWVTFCNSTGCGNTGNFEQDRKSVSNAQVYAPEYKVFINEPDPDIFPPAQILGSIIPPILGLTNCLDGSVDFVIEVDKAGFIGIELVFDPPYVTRNLTTGIEAGVDTIHWDGNDGSTIPQPVPNNTSFTFTVSYINGLTNLPLYDVESNNQGFAIELISPAGTPPLVFWDDSNISGGTTNLTGCASTTTPWSGCHDFPDGDYNTMNTWWYTSSISTAPVTLIEARCPAELVFVQPTQNYCAGATGIPISVFIDENSETYHWDFTGNDVTITQINPSDNSITIDLGPLATTGYVTVYGFNTTCDSGDTSRLFIGIQETPLVDAGLDDTICVNQTVTLAGDTTHSSFCLWNSLGDGAFNNSSILTPVYTPGSGDIINGSVQLILTGSSVTPCTGSVKDTMLLTFDPLPIPDAGNDTTICENSIVTLAGDTTHSSACYWASTGDGSFDDINILNATYTPGTADITNTSVVLTLTADAVSPCTTSRQDDMTIFFDPLPVANAGGDEIICVDQSITLSGSSQNSATSLWTTLGDGTFNDATLDNATYTPGTNDLLAGSIDLIFIANGIVPCNDTDQDTLLVSFTPLPIADPGVDSTICENGTLIMYGDTTNASALTWMTNGDGIFSDDQLINAEYFPGTADIANGSVTLTLRAFAKLPCTTPVQDNLILSFYSLPIPDAGIDTTICENGILTLYGDTTFTSTISWSTLGDGTFDDSNLINATYTPGANDLIATTVVLVLNANPNFPCTDSQTDSLTLSFDPLPIANSGLDDTICVNQSYTLSGSTANSNTSLWTTLGDGTFNDDLLPLAEYTPGTNDLIAGSVDLIFRADAIVPCTDANQDTMNLAFDPLPIADAGNDTTICVNQNVVLQGDRTYSNASTWTSAGDGTFDDATLLGAVYTPGIGDLGAGFVDLTLTADAINPCIDVNQDNMTLSFDPLPVPSAGVDDTICVNQTFALLGSTTHSNTSLWTTLGDGTFDDASLLSAIYTPGAADVGAGSVVLILTADAITPCLDAQNDSLTLTFDPLPIANAGGDKNICLNTSIILVGDTTYSSTCSWSTAGDGSFDNNTLINPTYTPGTGDRANGSVVLTLTADAEVPCTDSHSNDMTLFFDALPLPQIAITPNDTVCVNSITSFSGTDNSGLNIVSWGWDFGDGNDDIGQNTTHTYTGVLTDSVMLWVIDDLGCTDTTYHDIWVTDPVIGFIVDVTPVCFEDTVTFTGTGDIVTYTDWLWDFGDGNIGTGRDTMHVYATPGTYNITLDVCSKSASDDAVVLAKAVANAGSSHTICMDNPFDFSTSTTPPDTISADSVLWYGGAGTFNDPKLLLPTYYNGVGELGDVTLSMIAYGKLPCSDDTSTMILSIDSVPDGNFIYTPIDTSCVNGLVSFDASSSVIINTWDWDYGDGNIGSGQNTIHEYEFGDTTFYVTLSFSNIYGCSATYNDSIYVDSVFTDFSIQEPIICFKETAIFSGTGDDIVHSDWEWDFGDGNSSIGKNQTHTYLSPGLYDVRLNVCTDTTIHQVLVNTLPESDFAISPNDTTCMGELVDFNAVDITSDIVGWNWEFGDGNIANGQDVSHTYNVSGDLNILSIYTNVNGCIDTTIHTRNIQNVNIGFNMIQSPTCQNFNVDFIGTGDRVTFTPWNWTFGDGSPANIGIDVSHIYSLPDTVDVILDVCSEQDIQELIINATCEVDAGSNQITCQDVYFDLTESATPPTADNFSSILWTALNGIGTFNDPTLLAPTYFPHTSEGSVVNDTIDMMMVGYGIAPCENDTSYMELVVIPGAYAQAGSDENTCFGVPYDFANSTDSSFATNYVTLYWLTSGTGTFLNGNTTKPTYVPGANEIGPVTLSMVAANVIACDSIDEMILTIRPTYEVPVDVTVCYYDSAFAQGQWRYISGTYFDTLYTAGFGCDSVIVTNLTVRDKVDRSFVISTGDSICNGESVGFTSVGTANLVDWSWDFGDGTTSDEMNPVHFYNIAGYFTVTYFYTDDNGCSDSTTNQVQVFDLPDVTFTMNMTNACVNTQVGFIGSSNSNIVSWDWDFGDGGTGSGQTITHTYTSWGNLDVVLTVTDINGCNESYLVEINIAQPPVADFTYAPLVCDSLQFTDLSTSAAGYNLVSWDWDFGDGLGTSNLQNPTYQYASNTTPGGEVYQVTLTVMADSSGFICSDSIVLPVTVPSLPDIFFTYMPDPTCLGDSTYFYGESGFPIDVWHWDFDDGNVSNDQYASHLYTLEGDYNVVLTITDTNLCQNTLTNVITVSPVPTVSFSMSDTTACHGTEIQFTSTNSTNVETWYWDFGDGSFSPEDDPIHYFPQGGTYTVTLTVTDSAGCEAEASNQVLILPGATADFTYQNLTCSSVLFQDLSIAPPGYFITNWLWDFGDGFTANVQNPSHSYVTGIGVYDVTLIVTADSSGYSCNDTITQTIYTPGLPTVFFTWTPEPTMLGNQTDFFGTSGNQITDWYWDFDDGNFATTQDATNTFATVGTFDVELTVTDIDGCQNTILHTVSVTNVPELDYSWNYSCMGEPVQFNVESPPTDIPAVVSWDWDFGDGGISTDMNPLHVYPVAGTYNVSLTIVDTMAATNTIIKQIVVNPLPVALFSIDPLTCAMNDVQFHDLSTTPTGFITQWHWEFGDGNTQTVNFPNDPDVIYQYAAIGTYTVSLTITNSDSCENTTTNDITITASPTAMFSHSEGCESNPFTFTDTSIENGGGIILQWNWDFGDLASGTDNTSTLQNPVHMFSAAGSYDVELMIMNSNGCTDTTTMTITVEEDPEVEFSWTANCQGEETLFEVDETITNVTEVETFAWTFGDGGTSNLQNPTHIYTVAGDYTVTLMITTTAQCMASVTHTVPINPLPTANFDHDAPACLNQEVEFTDLSSSQNGLIETWEWDFGDGNTITITAPDNPDVTHLYTSDGNYDVMLTVTDGEGCINEVTKNVEVVSNPIADFNYDETCYNEPVYFTDMSIENGGPDIQSWEWFFGDPASGTNNNSNLQNPTHVFTAPGVYTTTLIIISTMGCSDTTEQDITIDELPLASIGVADDSICLGQLAEFTGTGTNISTWYWEFGDGGTSIDQNPSYMYQSPGEYIVTLTVTGIGTEQCTFTTDTTITVNGAPEAMFEYENTCLGDSTYFTDLSYSQYGFVSQWDWDFGDGNTSTMEDPSHYYLSNDDYEVTLIVTDNYGCSDTIALWVQVYDSPNPSFTWDQVCDPVGQVNYFDESTPGTDGAPIVGWSWELDDGYFSSEIDPSYIYNIIDTCYTVLLTVTDNNGCESTDTNTQVCLHGELEIDFTTTTVCQNQETTFTAIYGPQSDSVASYTWNFNDGSPIEITYYDTIAHIFPQPGMYIVELTAVDTNDCMATIYKEVTVDSLPTAQFTNTIGNCATATEFTDISLGGGEFIENWLWNFGDIASPDNTSTLQNPTHLYGPNDSIYHVKLIVTNFNGCIDSIEQDVYVEPCVVANFELPVGNNCARTELCFTDTSNITSNNNAIDQWRWEFGDGQTYNYGDHQNPICHTYDDAGDYDVQLIVVATINGTTYQDTMVRTLTVNPTPLAEIGVTNNCLNDTTRFYDNSTTFGAPILTYEWTFGDETTANDTSSMQDPKYKYPSYGDYITQLIVDNEYGCIDTITDTITVFKLPEAEFSFEELCMSYYTYFTDESIGDSSDIANYNWTFDINQHDTNTSIEPSPVNIYDTAGIYYPRLVIMDENLCKDSIDKVVDIKPIPTSNFMIVDTIQQGNIYLQNLSQDVTGLQDGLTYYWDFDYDYGQSSTEVSPTHQYEVDGNYDVMLVSYNEFNCPDTMHQIYNLLFTNLFVPNAFSPSSALTDLQIFKPTGINIKSYRLEVYSAWGNLVFESTKLDNGAPMEGWDGTYKNKDLPTGSYIWRISAVFEDGEHWKGTDNGDGNSATSGSVTLIR